MAKNIGKYSWLTARRIHLGVGLGLGLAMVVCAPLPEQASTEIGGETRMEMVAGDVEITTKLAMQLPAATYRLTQKFSRLHPAVDLAMPVGSVVRPIMDGVVMKIEKKNWGYGNNVVVQHGSEYESLYAHLSQVWVKEGEWVDKDTVLGLSGSTGHSTGPHLHLEIRDGGKYVDPGEVLGIYKDKVDLIASSNKGN